MSRRGWIAAGALAALLLSGTVAVAQSHEQPHAAEVTHAPAGGDGHGGEHAGAHHGPAPINWLDFSDKHRPAFVGLLINFGILVALYWTLGKKPIAAGLKQRRVDIGKDIEDARRMLEEAKERAKKYQGDLGNADSDAETAKAALVTAGQSEAARVVADADERAARMKRDAERLVAQERKQLEHELLVETVDQAVATAEQVLQARVTPEDHARLARELLAELAQKPAAPRVAQGGVS